VVAEFLRERGIVPEKNDLNTILFLVTLGIEVSKAGTLITTLVDFKTFFDDNAQLRAVLPQFTAARPQVYAVGGELITGHGARPGKTLVRRDPQRLLGGRQVPDLNAITGGHRGGAACRVGGKDHHPHRRNRPDAAEDARYTPVK